MKNKQGWEWEEELKQLMGYVEVTGEYRSYDWKPYNEIKVFIHKQLTKAREEGRREGMANKTTEQFAREVSNALKEDSLSGFRFWLFKESGVYLDNIDTLIGRYKEYLKTLK